MKRFILGLMVLSLIGCTEPKLLTKQELLEVEKEDIIKCNNGELIACKWLSIRYNLGTYGEINKEKELIYAKKACKLGDEQSCIAVELSR